MARFYFDTHDGTEVRDEIGQEVEDHQSLREEALIVAAQRSAAIVKQHDLYAVVVTVRNSANETVLTCRLAAQVESGQRPPLQAR